VTNSHHSSQLFLFISDCVIRFPFSDSNSTNVLHYDPGVTQNITRLTILFWIRASPTYNSGHLSIIYYMLPGTKQLLLTVENPLGSDSLLIKIPNYAKYMCYTHLQNYQTFVYKVVIRSPRAFFHIWSDITLFGSRLNVLLLIFCHFVS